MEYSGRQLAQTLPRMLKSKKGTVLDREKLSDNQVKCETLTRSLTGKQRERCFCDGVSEC